MFIMYHSKFVIWKHYHKWFLHNHSTFFSYFKIPLTQDQHLDLEGKIILYQWHISDFQFCPSKPEIKERKMAIQWVHWFESDLCSCSVKSQPISWDSGFFRPFLLCSSNSTKIQHGIQHLIRARSFSVKNKWTIKI